MDNELIACMPVIVPAANQDVENYFDSFNSGSTLNAVTDENDELHIIISGSDYSAVYAMFSGFLNYYPVGSVLPDGQTASGEGVLQLQTAPDMLFFENLPPGIPPLTDIFYYNMDQNSIRPALEPLLQILPENYLLSIYNGANPHPSREQLEENFLDQFMLGQKTLFVETGAAIGQGQAVTGEDNQASTELALKFFTIDSYAISPVLYLKTMPQYAGEEWEDHPLVSAVSAMPVPVNIYLQFEVWDQASNTFLILTEGIEVALMDHDDISGDDELALETPDISGIVHFNIPDINTIAGEAPDIYFLVKNNNNYAGYTLPELWSTRGWNAVNAAANNNPFTGYYADFSGTQLGTPANPLVFRIGLDIHLKFLYSEDLTGYSYGVSNMDRGMPKGIPVKIHGPDSEHIFMTDESSEIHGIIFDIEGESDVYFEIFFEVEDPSINLPKAVVYTGSSSFGDEAKWCTDIWNADRVEFPDNCLTSLGEKDSPLIIRATSDNHNVSCFFLKCWYELSHFLFHATQEDWPGIEDFKIQYNDLITCSWPVGQVNYHEYFFWNRRIIIHEMAHQIMWILFNITSPDIVGYVITGDLELLHAADEYTNPCHAMMEAWAEFIEHLFDESYYLTNINPLEDGCLLGPPPNNKGESVEGALSNALLQLHKKYIAGPVISTPGADSVIKRSYNGDITILNPWITTQTYKDAFNTLIWQPFKQLAVTGQPDTTAMIEKIKLNNLNDWFIYAAEFQIFNMAIVCPVINSLSSNSGPAGGGNTIIITGENFVINNTVTISGSTYKVENEIKFGTNNTSGLIIINSQELEVTVPPGQIGQVVDVSLTFTVNNHLVEQITLTDAYNYT